MLRAATVAIAIMAMASAANAAGYVPRMTCEEVGAFAQDAARAKMRGESLTEQIAELQESYPPERATTTSALIKIVTAIYRNPVIAKSSPGDVGPAFERTCELRSHSLRSKKWW